MSTLTAILAEDLSKAYRMWSSPSARLTVPIMESLAAAVPNRFSAVHSLRRHANGKYRDFWALHNVSMSVDRGECVGIIGRNGSGKSTLLQIIAGTLKATSGTVDRMGRVAAILELGAGFNPEFSGRENVFLNAAVLGLSKAETERKLPAIVAFAEIGDFLDEPIKTYSSGMLVRLAFATQTVIEPEILIVDEALSVGDFFFQQKCFKRIAELKARGTTILFVSHDMASVRDLCQRTLYLRNGGVAYWGDTQEAIARYFSEGSESKSPPAALSSDFAQQPLSVDFDLEKIRSRAFWWNSDEGSGKESLVRLHGVILEDSNQHPTESLEMGSRLLFRVIYQAFRAGNYHVAIEIKNRYDQVVACVGSYGCGLEPPRVTAGQVLEFGLSMMMNFESGSYTLQVIVGQHAEKTNRGERLAATPWLGPISLTWDYENKRAPFLGMFGPPVSASFSATSFKLNDTSKQGIPERSTQIGNEPKKTT